ncbi:hypothetical protein AB1Y20_011186 [Prymnesium parvum]|uniref:F-box domain-containing protein n=1 Tax=Prymnesium parvum TaxID=97485 RepID=A0AB34IPT1_PRYPA|mmetsp:Transcript_36982/g.92012  ORF Transcript_36982/g.92012 Transcript_36982/m.92012 type:complete len:366 (+) Transcript_36982:122-1219(+)|eukprot:CAMPEP_0113266910 /NCGR_PEP_ID=MMETSP0008_2-20120614/20319_1 /TAXON_ID=97485 /ORGANISM="Prymnesium parvum" /LENGTH=365 /DNA_ID=CAMNT_0000115891 /DNA_START=80 /DNA_END=1180 /DNA_ORIENTATION=- /assembly_acc=CAM_ASM_000153
MQARLLPDLPDSLLAEIALRDMACWPHLAATSRAMHSLVLSIRLSLTATDGDALRLGALPPPTIDLIATRRLGALPNLLSLTLRSLPLTPAFFHGVPQLCPRLASLDLRGCTRLTDRCVRGLARLPRLEALDLTFCTGVSYASVVFLRRQCATLREIRRQPEWFDGQYETPWGEVHTYYADGSFDFGRSIESRGWIAQMVDHGTHLENRLVYVDVADSSELGERGSAYNGRIGVLLRQDDEGHVLVVQDSLQPEPPAYFPTLGVEATPEVGHSKRIQQRSPRTSTFSRLLVSCMRTLPLDDHASRLAPASLFEALAAFCERMSAAELPDFEQKARDSMSRRRRTCDFTQDWLCYSSDSDSSDGSE